MAKMHFDDHPMDRNLFNIEPEDIKGTKFEGWQKNARYTVRITIILQIDTTNVSKREYSVAPNITFLSTNQAVVNVFKVWTRDNISFHEFQDYYQQREAGMERYISELLTRLNNARALSNQVGSWYINYSLNDRYIEIGRPSG